MILHKFNVSAYKDYHMNWAIGIPFLYYFLFSQIGLKSNLLPNNLL